jgi:hypothetical protein
MLASNSREAREIEGLESDGVVKAFLNLFRASLSLSSALESDVTLGGCESANIDRKGDEKGGTKRTYSARKNKVLVKGSFFDGAYLGMVSIKISETLIILKGSIYH